MVRTSSQVRLPVTRSRERLAHAWSPPIPAARESGCVPAQTPPLAACTVQGMARVRSGQAPAWPLVSGRSARSGSGVKRDFPCTLTGTLPPALVVLRAQSRLRLEGRVRTLSGHPGSEPSQNSCTFRSTWGRGPGSHRQIRVRAVVNAVTGTPRASLLKTVAALPRRRSGRPSLPR